MNPETPQSRPEHNDERRLGDALLMFSAIDKLGFGSRAPDVQARWQEGVDRYGTAFVAYLGFERVNPDDPEVLQHFDIDYVATYSTQNAAIAAFVEDMGWATEREEFGRLHPETELYLAWDVSEIETRMGELYEVVQLNGKTIVFLR
ncbi:MAG TPA: hypothetical protein VHX87_06735 [Galbitalea sp.]|jgi:hypothetical protein|nr:hypothetical protein [Galbitalea sp.]